MLSSRRFLLCIDKLRQIPGRASELDRNEILPDSNIFLDLVRNEFPPGLQQFLNSRKSDMVPVDLDLIGSHFRAPQFRAKGFHSMADSDQAETKPDRLKCLRNSGAQYQMRS